jgi:hypothetical protein
MLWTFGRADEHLTIERDPASHVLVVTMSGEEPRRYPFDNSSSRDAFQADMVAFLLSTGWTLLKFAPERRRGRDRRGFPRLDERRRWWTDSVEVWKSLTRK